MTNSSHVVALERETDIYLACEKAAALAAAAGFDRYACADIETAVSEITNNALRHADGGWAAIRLSDDDFEVVVTDRGTGESGPRRSSGLGIGLQGAGRLMTSFTFTPLPTGSTVTMSRQRPQQVARRAGSQWSVTAVYRAKSGNTTSGDAAEVRELPDGSIRAALADGLGSGEMASAAARQVLDALDLEKQPGPAEAIVAADASTRHTRGAAISVIFLSADGSGVHAGLGDVTCQITAPAQRVVNRPGIVGTGNGSPVDTPVRVAAEGAVLLWTDGLRVSETQLRELQSEPSIESMERTVMADEDHRDDAAFVMVRRLS